MYTSSCLICLTQRGGAPALKDLVSKRKRKTILPISLPIDLSTPLRHSGQLVKKLENKTTPYSPPAAAASLAGLSRRGDAEPSSSLVEGAAGGPSPVGTLV